MGSGSASSATAAAEFQSVLEDVLTETDADEQAGPLLRAAGLRIRFEFPDLPLVLSLAATDEGKHHLSWRLDDRQYRQHHTLDHD